MRLYNFKKIMLGAAMAIASVGVTSCVGDLDVENINPQKTPTTNYDYILNKVYANMVLTGQKGPDGEGDLEDIDEGTSSMIRQLWNANSLSTDEAKCIWGDAGIPEFNNDSWSDSHPMMKALYYRLYFGITLANYYITNQGGEDTETLTKRAEARFMRALYYYYLIDLWGNVPIKTTVSTEQTPQSPRADVFAFIESELKDIIGEGEGNEILADKRPVYGRADKIAAYILLSRLYLNAEVYTGTAQWQKAKDYASKAISEGKNQGYDLSRTAMNGYSAYQLLFMGDNDTNGAEKEIVLPAIHDGEQTQTWGGCLFIIASTNSTSKYKIDLGTKEQWGGNRVTKQYAEKFLTDQTAPNDSVPAVVAEAAGDDRALFSCYKHSISMDDPSDFFSGYAYNKFTNVHADGTKPHHTQFVDTDFPMIRMAEAYLNYAEADARLNGNRCSADGLAKVKELRNRAHASAITAETLDDLCDEWAREFGFENMRRTTLIRFGKFGGDSNYYWQWKGGSENGKQIDKKYNLFAIPNSVVSDVIKQNPGY